MHRLTLHNQEYKLKNNNKKSSLCTPCCNMCSVTCLSTFIACVDWARNMGNQVQHYESGNLIRCVARCKWGGGPQGGGGRIPSSPPGTVRLCESIDSASGPPIPCMLTLPTFLSVLNISFLSKANTVICKNISRVSAFRHLPIYFNCSISLRMKK